MAVVVVTESLYEEPVSISYKLHHTPDPVTTSYAHLIHTVGGVIRAPSLNSTPAITSAVSVTASSDNSGRHACSNSCTVTFKIAFGCRLCRTVISGLLADGRSHSPQLRLLCICAAFTNSSRHTFLFIFSLTGLL